MDSSYLILKFLHILSAVVVAGTGFGIAYFMFMVHRSGDSHTIAVIAKYVVLADWIFTTPAIITQFITGILLMQELNYSFTSLWFIAVIGLFVFIGVCWIPVVAIQYRLRKIAAVNTAGTGPGDEFRRLMRIWTVLGILAFTAILIMFWLMIFKPLPQV